MVEKRIQRSFSKVKNESIAWFTMSRETETDGVQMMSSDLPFELKTLGSISPNSDLIESMGYLSGASITGGATTATVGDIKWLLAPNDDMTGEGLRPGTQGSLNFTVDPIKKDSSKNLVIKYKLELTAYQLTDEMKERIAEETAKKLNDEPYTMPTITPSDLIPLSDDPLNINYTKAVDFIKGHILLFKNADNTGRFGFGEVQTITFNSANEQVIPIHWIWAETIGDIVLTGDGINNICTGDEKVLLITHIKNNPSLYFDLSDLDADMLARGKIKDSVFEEELSDYYPTMNMAYNNADQTIGVDVQYILIELIVDGELEDVI